jgi:pyrimidine operon attenuation protein/uracil phosphoribosyltransferase
MEDGKIILEKGKFNLTLERLSHQLIENHGDFENTCLIGIQEKGVLLANRLSKIIKKNNRKAKFDYGKLDITFYRDDFRRRNKPLSPSNTEIEFVIEGKKIILFDDVLYTGRTIQAALSAIGDFGRPSQVELVTLVNRRFNRHLPITADYTGINVDALDEAYVRVEWMEEEKEDRILLFAGKDKK